MNIRLYFMLLAQHSRRKSFAPSMLRSSVHKL